MQTPAKVTIYAIYASCRHRLLISETSTFLTEKMRQHAPTKNPRLMSTFLKNYPDNLIGYGRVFWGADGARNGT